jgi:hypothetical protein
LVNGEILRQNRPTEPREEATTKTIKLLLSLKTGREKETPSPLRANYTQREKNIHRKLQAKKPKRNTLGGGKQGLPSSSTRRHQALALCAQELEIAREPSGS